MIANVNGHDPEAIRTAIEQARNKSGRPSIICCKTVIGYGSPNKAGKESSHGSALGEEEVELTRQRLGWTHAPFEIPADIHDSWNACETGMRAQGRWQEMFAEYEDRYPQLAAEFKRRTSGMLPDNWEHEALHSLLPLTAGSKPLRREKPRKTRLKDSGHCCRS